MSKKDDKRKVTVSVEYVGKRSKITAFGIKFKKGEIVEVNPNVLSDPMGKSNTTILDKLIGNPYFNVDDPANYSMPAFAVRENKIVRTNAERATVVKESLNVFLGTKQECVDWIEAHGDSNRESHRIVSTKNG